MSWHPTAKLSAYLALIALGLLSALASGRVEPAIMAVPLAMIAAFDLAAAERPGLHLRVRLDADTATEGDHLEMVIEITADAAVPRVELFSFIPAGLARRDGRVCVQVRAGARRCLRVDVGCRRWGNYRLGETWIRARSHFGMLQCEGHVPATLALRVYPTPEVLRRLVDPLDTQTSAGNQTARSTGAGVELAELRPFAAGDRGRDVNWRATARRGDLWVTARRPDRASDVVLFLDTFDEVTLAAAVRATDAMVGAYLDHHDRVGLITFGGALRWVRPGMGLRQQYLIVDALLAAAVFDSVAWRGVGHIPPRMFPPKALILAVTALEDERTLGALIDLHSRGLDLAAVEISPMPYPSPPAGPAGQLAERLWLLQRSVRRERYRAMGVPVVAWTPERTLSGVVEELGAWPRRGRRVG